MYEFVRGQGWVDVPPVKTYIRGRFRYEARHPILGELSCFSNFDNEFYVDQATGEARLDEWAKRHELFKLFDEEFAEQEQHCIKTYKWRPVWCTMVPNE